MPGSRTATRDTLNGVNSNTASYSTWMGCVFIFNLIVGTGALTLPGIFAKAGWFLSLIIIILLAFISYITVTFVIETIAAANAVKTWQNLQVLKRSVDFESREDVPHASAFNEAESDVETDDPTYPILSANHDATARLERMPLYAHGSTLVYYKLDEKVELGEMATLFFNDFGRVLFYICICIYLYGDLSIYSAAVAKSLRDLICDHLNSTRKDNFSSIDFGINEYNLDNNDTNEDAIRQCSQNNHLTRLDVYRLFVVGFTVILGPFVALSIQKTKYIQIISGIFRWCAFIFMISIALKLLITDGAKGHPVSINICGLPALLGACVYSFMCHHSLPSLLAPIRDKKALLRILCADYVVICMFYILLAMTGIFAFERLQDLYTLNFIPDQTHDYSFAAEILVVIDYFLAFFPVVTLSASFPIIAITLRNNLQALFLDMTRFESYNYFVKRLLFPLMALLPPFTITYFTENLTSLVAFTGSYAGTAIQYLIPIALVYYARITCRELLGSGVVNDYKSPFSSKYWLAFVLIWALGCISLVTINFFLNVDA